MPFFASYGARTWRGESRLWRKCWERLLSHCMTPSSLIRRTQLGLSGEEEILVDVPAGNWARLMELVEGLAKLEPEPSKSASQLQLGLAAHHDDK